MYSKDVYSYLAQSQICRLGLDPYRVLSGDRPGPRPRLHLVGAQPVAGDPGALRAAVFVDRPRDLGVDRENIVAAVLCHRLMVLLGVGLIVWGDTAAGPPLRGGRGSARCGRRSPIRC